MRMAIVGGGASGVLSAVHLARCWTGSSRPEVILYDGSARVARGAAYSTGDPRHLLNVPASRMSALADDPSHFVRWLGRHDPAATPEDYRPRVEYGDYLAQCLAHHARFVSLIVRHAEVHDIEPSARRWRVRHARGDDEVDAVVLALGHAAPLGLPVLGSPSERYASDPWVPGALDRLIRATAAGDAVLVVGTGLTAVDVALSLVPNDRRVVAVSRHGLLPATQRDTMPTPLPLVLPNVTTMTAAEVERLVVRHVSDVTSSGGDWRAAIDGVRPVTAQLWQRMSVDEKALFLHGASRLWEVVRHRMSPEVARCIDAWRASGRFDAQQGEVVAAVHASDRVRLTLRRGDGGLEGVEAAAVVNCTGPVCDIDAYPLGRQLHERGLVQPDPLGLGVVVTDDGSAVSAGGHAEPRLRVVGALRRGALYESTAIPELRDQAAQIATQLSATQSTLNGPH
jgi:uncharacterized NAD(P)/FAD-binding protein YdhS